MVRAFDGVLRFPVAVLQLFRGRMRRQLYPLWHTCILQPDSVLNVVVADERTLDYPRDLTGAKTAQSGFYTHRGLGEQASSIRPGALTPDTPSPVASSRTWMDLRRRHGKMRERFCERLNSTYS